MVNVVWTDKFENKVRKIKDSAVKEKIKKQIEKIIGNPVVGKPLRLSMKGEKTLRVHPFRIIYSTQNNTIYLLDFDHRKNVYQ